MYSGGCVFVDHASGYIHVEFQCHLNTHETLEAKDKFELMCRDVGIIPQRYQSDNGSAFTSAGFTANLRAFSQIIRFAGSGAHHHNGIAERAIRTILTIARTAMLHSAIHWPELADTALWPMAVAHATFLYNHVPNVETGIAPVDLFTRTRWGNSVNSMTFMFGDALSIFSTRPLPMERNCPDGSLVPNGLCIWGCPPSMPVRFR
jgi:hypothetical protein